MDIIAILTALFIIMLIVVISSLGGFLITDFIGDKIDNKISKLEHSEYIYERENKYSNNMEDVLIRLKEFKTKWATLNKKKVKIEFFSNLFDCMTHIGIVCIIIFVIGAQLVEPPKSVQEEVELRVARAVQQKEDYRLVLDELKTTSVLEYSTVKIDDNLDEVKITVKSSLGKTLYATRNTTLYIENAKNKVYTDLDDAITD